MNQFWKFFILSLSILIAACQGNVDRSKTTDAKSEVVSEFLISSLQADDDTTLLRVAFIGDGEPKPCAEFPIQRLQLNKSTHLCKRSPSIS